MIRTRGPFTRLLTALTPVLLLWAFAGCAAACAEHAEGARGEEVSAASAELRDSHCPDPCPVKEATAFVPAQRFAPDQQAAGAQPAAAPAARGPQRAASFAAHLSEVLRPPPDPFFERPRPLRI